MFEAAQQEPSRFARFASELYPRRVRLVDGVDDKGNRVGFGMKEVSRVECQISRFQNEGDEEIVLAFDSRGGLLEAAEHLRTVIELSNVPIYGLVIGECRSSAFYIFQACHKRLALPNTHLRFHDMSRRIEFDLFAHDDSEVIGRDAATAARMHIPLIAEMRKQIAENYQRAIPHLSLEKILELMRESDVMTSEEALLMHFIDEVVFA